MDRKPKEGEVVCLNSGGPNMTVTNELDETFCGQVICSWFDEEYNKRNGFFPFQSLTLVQP
jgi:uncharacterized protein YodC (DUF2158 family)